MHNMQYYINMNTIVTDDHSRVRLSEIPDKMGSDYINGNFIDVSCFALALTSYDICRSLHNLLTSIFVELQGYKQPNAFIATQGKPGWTPTISISHKNSAILTSELKPSIVQVLCLILYLTFGA